MTPSRAIVENKVRNDSLNEMDEVMAILDRYGDPTTIEEGRARIPFAALKLAKGSRGALQDFVDLAIKDLRDVLAPAGYPLESNARQLARPNLSPEQGKELEAIRKQDREQYLRWSRNA